MYLCNCYGTTEQDVIDLVHSTHAPFVFAGIANKLRGTGSCCKCLPRTKEVIDAAVKQKAISKQAEATCQATIGHAEFVAGVLTQS